MTAVDHGYVRTSDATTVALDEASHAGRYAYVDCANAVPTECATTCVNMCRVPLCAALIHHAPLL